MTSLRYSVYPCTGTFKGRPVMFWGSVWTFPYVRRWAACCVMRRTATLTSSGSSCATSSFSTTLSLPMLTWSEISLPTSGIAQFFLFPRAFNRLFSPAFQCCGSLIQCFLTPGSGMEKIQIWDPGSGALLTLDPESGMEKFGIRKKYKGLVATCHPFSHLFFLHMIHYRTLQVRITQFLFDEAGVYGWSSGGIIRITSHSCDEAGAS